ncbi:STAS domain-containing protein, partial [Streptomyces sp. NPDC048281]|uniref:STAS domain-containing protein n=1 Tax=Streptomyces sp. NPDC048281 TaxID=3154715 RepID=UPI00344558F6
MTRIVPDGTDNGSAARGRFGPGGLSHAHDLHGILTGMSSGSGGRGGEPDPAAAHAGSLPRLEQREQGDAWVVALFGAFDPNSVPALSEALKAGARTHAKVVVDAAGLTFADSAVLNVLLSFNRTAVLRVARPARQFARVLDLTGA